jgi:hypothetical protein
MGSQSVLKWVVVSSFSGCFSPQTHQGQNGVMKIDLDTPSLLQTISAHLSSINPKYIPQAYHLCPWSTFYKRCELVTAYHGQAEPFEKGLRSRSTYARRLHRVPLKERRYVTEKYEPRICMLGSHTVMVSDNVHDALPVISNAYMTYQPLELTILPTDVKLKKNQGTCINGVFQQLESLHCSINN